MSGRVRIRATLLALLLFAIAVPTALAATIVSNEEYVLGADETIEGDLYVFANKVRIDGRIDGDLVSGAGEIVIGPDGTVTQDLIAGAQSIIIEGEVGDDVRAAGFLIRLASGGETADDFIAAGYSVEADDGSVVRGDMIGAGYQGRINGEVGRNVWFAGEAIELEGTVSGDLTAEVGGEGGGPPMFFFPGLPEVSAIRPGFQYGEQARVDGRLQVTSPMDLEIPARISEDVDLIKVEPEPEAEEAVREAQPEPMHPAVRWFISWLKDYVALAVVGLLLLWLATRLMAAAAAMADSQVLVSAGWGCLSLFAVFVLLLALSVATLLAFIVVGVLKVGPLVGPVFSTSALLGATLAFGTYLLTWVGRVVAGEWIGRLIVRNPTPGTPIAKYGPLLVGLAVFAVLINIPHIGFIFSWLGAILGLGALVLVTRPHWPSTAAEIEAEAAAA